MSVYVKSPMACTYTVTKRRARQHTHTHIHTHKNSHGLSAHGKADILNLLKQRFYSGNVRRLDSFYQLVFATNVGGVGHDNIIHHTCAPQVGECVYVCMCVCVCVCMRVNGRPKSVTLM